MPVDLVLLGIMLPRSSGLDLCRTSRAKSQLPVIMVTARGDGTNRVVGLELGANEHPQALQPGGAPGRIRAVLRRAQAVPERPGARMGDRIRFAGWMLDPRRRDLTAPDGSTVDLSGGEYHLPLAFASIRSASSAATGCSTSPRNRFADSVDSSVDVKMSRLRLKVEPTEGSPAVSPSPICRRSSSRSTGWTLPAIGHRRLGPRPRHRPPSDQLAWWHRDLAKRPSGGLSAIVELPRAG